MKLLCAPLLSLFLFSTTDCQVENTRFIMNPLSSSRALLSLPLLSMSLSSSSSWTLFALSLSLISPHFSCPLHSFFSLSSLPPTSLQMAYSVVRAPSNFFPYHPVSTLVLQWHHLCVCSSLKLFPSHSSITLSLSVCCILFYTLFLSPGQCSSFHSLSLFLSLNCYSTLLFHSIDSSNDHCVHYNYGQLTNLQFTPLFLFI